MRLKSHSHATSKTCICAKGRCPSTFTHHSSLPQNPPASAMLLLGLQHEELNPASPAQSPARRTGSDTTGMGTERLDFGLHNPSQRRKSSDTEKPSHSPKAINTNKQRSPLVFSNAVLETVTVNCEPSFVFPALRQGLHV